MQVEWKEGDEVKEGIFLGLLQIEEDLLAIVRPDDYGLMLKSMHPSCLHPVE